MVMINIECEKELTLHWCHSIKVSIESHAKWLNSGINLNHPDDLDELWDIYVDHSSTLQQMEESKKVGNILLEEEEVYYLIATQILKPIFKMLKEAGDDVWKIQQQEVYNLIKNIE